MKVVSGRLVGGRGGMGRAGRVAGIDAGPPLHGGDAVATRNLVNKMVRETTCLDGVRADVAAVLLLLSRQARKIALGAFSNLQQSNITSLGASTSAAEFVPQPRHNEATC